MHSEQPITDALRQAIETSGLSIKALERETGVSRQSMMHFMRGTRTLRLEIADKLATFFKLDVRPAIGNATTKAPTKRTEN